MIQSFMPEKFDVIYGALVGGCLAGGVAVVINVLSHRQALKKLNLELSHQAQQREKERQLTLKREIYIPLMEAASNAMSFYAQIGSVPSELIQRPEPLNALSRQISKMSVVASKDVMETVYAAQKNLAVETTKLFEERMPIEFICSQIKSVESQIKVFESRNETFTQRFEKHIDDGTGTGGLTDVLMRFINEHEETIKKLHAQKAELILQKCTLELNILKLAGQGIKAMSGGNKAALVAIRKDLGFPVEEAWLSGLLDANSKEVFAAVEKFANKMQKTVAEAKSGKGPA